MSTIIVSSSLHYAKDSHIFKTIFLSIQSLGILTLTPSGSTSCSAEAMDDRRFCTSATAAVCCWALLSVFTINCMTVSWIPNALIRSGCWKNTLLSAKSLLQKRIN